MRTEKRFPKAPSWVLTLFVDLPLAGLYAWQILVDALGGRVDHLPEGISRAEWAGIEQLTIASQALLFIGVLLHRRFLSSGLALMILGMALTLLPAVSNGFSPIPNLLGITLVATTVGYRSAHGDKRLNLLLFAVLALETATLPAWQSLTNEYLQSRPDELLGYLLSNVAALLVEALVFFWAGRILGRFQQASAQGDAQGRRRTLTWVLSFLVDLPAGLVLSLLCHRAIISQAFLAGGYAQTSGYSGPYPYILLSLAAAGLITLGLVIHRHLLKTGLVLAILGMLCAFWLSTGVDTVAFFVAPLLVMPFTVGALRRGDSKPMGIWILCGSLILLAGASAGMMRLFPAHNTAGNLIVTVVAVLIGAALFMAGLGQRRRSEASAAELERLRLLQAQTAQERQLAAQDERARIAREMHDVVAHSLAVISMQAEGGRAALDSNPKAAGQALEQISATARTSLESMRGLLGVLRSSGGSEADDATAAGEGDAPTAPAPELADLPDLFEDFRRSGLNLRTCVSGDLAPELLAEGMELTLYRGAQEMLTNALRHGAPGGQVSLVQQWRPQEAALVCVTPLAETWSAQTRPAETPLPEAPSAAGEALAEGGDGVVGMGAAGSVSTGLGIQGMRERAALYDGQVEVTREDGLHTIRLSLPLKASDPASGKATA